MDRSVTTWTLGQLPLPKTVHDRLLVTNVDSLARNRRAFESDTVLLGMIGVVNDLQRS